MMWGVLTLVATWAFLYAGKEWETSERFGVAAGVLSNVGCDLVVAVGVTTERRLLTFSTILVGAVQVAPRVSACGWPPPAFLHPAFHLHLHTHPPPQFGMRMRPTPPSRIAPNRVPSLPQPTYLIYTMTDVFRQVFEHKTEK